MNKKNEISKKHEDNNLTLESVLDTFKVFLIISFHVILDTAFISLWLILQRFVESLIHCQIQQEQLMWMSFICHELGSIDEKILLIFQLVFTLSTLAFVGIAVTSDIVMVIIRTIRTIGVVWRELKSDDKSSGSDVISHNSKVSEKIDENDTLTNTVNR